MYAEYKIIYTVILKAKQGIQYVHSELNYKHAQSFSVNYLLNN